MKTIGVVNHASAAVRGACRQMGKGRMRTMIWGALVAGAALIASSGPAMAQAGKLDPTFGVGGVFQNNMGIFGTAVAVQSDGKIVVGGEIAPEAAVVRLTPNGSAVSSYVVNGDGTLSAISASVPTRGAANCWNAITPDGRFVYTGNSASANISGFANGITGMLTPLPGPVVGSNPPGAVNLDLAITADGKFLYSLNSGNGTIGIFAIQKDGTLTNATPVSGLPASAGFQGIAAY